jgi:hypothetical protein
VGLEEGYQAALHIYSSSGYRDPGHGVFIESSPGGVGPVRFLLKELPTYLDPYPQVSDPS